MIPGKASRKTVSIISVDCNTIRAGSTTANDVIKYRFKQGPTEMFDQWL